MCRDAKTSPQRFNLRPNRHTRRKVERRIAHESHLARRKVPTQRRVGVTVELHRMRKNALPGSMPAQVEVRVLS